MRDPDDDVDPADRKLHQILNHIAETTSDENQRRIALDLAPTLPPIKDWSENELRAAYEVFARIDLKRRQKAGRTSLLNRSGDCLINGGSDLGIGWHWLVPGRGDPAVEGDRKRV